MAQQFPQKFGPYTLHQLIARGGMAEIYRATMPGIGTFEKVLAIKKILPHLVENEEFITMLVDEARILVGLNHANIAQVYDLGAIDDSYYIAMEYVHGVDVATMIKEAGKKQAYLPYDHVTYIMGCLCYGLHGAHSAVGSDGRPLHLVHRDISPHNVLVSFGGEVKVIDFGVAKARSKDSSTKAGVIKGKLLYMAPEQAMAKEIDGRADLFAAGLCMYKMLTHKLPFEGDNEFQIYNNILTKEIEPPKLLNPGVPEELNQIAMTLLQRDPDKRYQDGYAAKKELDRALHRIAPGYTPSRLSRFVEDNYSYIVQERQRQAAEGSKTPSGPQSGPQQSPPRPQPPATPAPQTKAPQGFGPPSTTSAPNFGSDFGASPAPQGGAVAERVRTQQNSSPMTFGAMPQTPPPNQFGSFEQPQTPNPHQPTPLAMEQPIAAPQDTKRKTPPVLYGVVVLAIFILAMLAYAIMSNKDATAPTAPVTPPAAAAAAATPETIKVSLTSTPSGAKVFDEANNELGTTPFEGSIPTAQLPVLLELRLEGHAMLPVKITKTATTHSLELVADEPAEPSEPSDPTPDDGAEIEPAPEDKPVVEDKSPEDKDTDTDKAKPAATNTTSKPAIKQKPATTTPPKTTPPKTELKTVTKKDPPSDLLPISTGTKKDDSGAAWVPIKTKDELKDTKPKDTKSKDTKPKDTKPATKPKDTKVKDINLDW